MCAGDDLHVGHVEQRDAHWCEAEAALPMSVASRAGCKTHGAGDTVQPLPRISTQV
jgi:hypothetical protein